MTPLIMRPAAKLPLTSARRLVPHSLAGLRRPAFRFVGGEPVAFAPARSWYPSPALVGEGFLSGEENRRLLRYAVARQVDFVQALTTTRVNNYRIARVLPQFPEFQILIRERVAAVLPEVMRQFRIRNFSIGRIEAQLTVHGHGNFYKVHTDSSSAKTAERVLSFVYYFCREPRHFSGGELRIYDAVAHGGSWERGANSYHIAPVNNRIVFFLSRYHHEVLPIVCPSRRFADGRFTLNGWIRGEKTERRTATQSRHALPRVNQATLTGGPEARWQWRSARLHARGAKWARRQRHPTR
jgi:Rps23 Pro-64 3,4-dihydroxylase Tpa1-like proline 4-hydroxylase